MNNKFQVDFSAFRFGGRKSNVENVLSTPNGRSFNRTFVYLIQPFSNENENFHTFWFFNKLSALFIHNKWWKTKKKNEFFKRFNLIDDWVHLTVNCGQRAMKEETKIKRKKYSIAWHLSHRWSLMNGKTIYSNIMVDLHAIKQTNRKSFIQNVAFFHLYFYSK